MKKILKILNRIDNSIIYKMKLTKRESRLDYGIKLGIAVYEAFKKGVDLSYADLSGANLMGYNLSNINLQYVDLNESNLKHAILHSANFASTDLTRADLTNANLNNVNFNFCSLKNTNLTNATLNSADLKMILEWENVELEGANFSYATVDNECLYDDIISRAAKTNDLHLDRTSLNMIYIPEILRREEYNEHREKINNIEYKINIYANTTSTGLYIDSPHIGVNNYVKTSKICEQEATRLMGCLGMDKDSLYNEILMALENMRG